MTLTTFEWKLYLDHADSDCRFEEFGLGAKFGGAIRMNWGCVRKLMERNVVSGTCLSRVPRPH